MSQDGPEHGQQIWVALYDKSAGCSRETLRAEHCKMNHTKMIPDQDPDEFLYTIKSCRDRFNTSSPPEGPTDRQFENILQQALSPDYETVRIAYLERWDFGFEDIRRMMVVIYAGNLLRRSIITAGIAGPGAAMKAMDRDLNDVPYPNCSMFGHYRRNCPIAANSSIRADNTMNNPTDNSARASAAKEE